MSSSPSSAGSMLQPMFGQVGLTAAVFTYMAYKRLTTFQREKIRPQAASDRHNLPAPLLKPEVVNPANNFNNLCELPMLFYPACLLLHFSKDYDALDVKLAWGFVAFRGLHSLIHCTSNTVKYRFVAFCASSSFLWALWARTAWRMW